MLNLIPTAGRRVAAALSVMVALPCVAVADDTPSTRDDEVGFVLIANDEATAAEPGVSAESARLRARGRMGRQLVILGTACAAFGALSKLGSNEVAYDSNDRPRRHYNAVNYALMIGGGTAALAGLGFALTAGRLTPVSLRMSREHVQLAASVRF